MSYFHFDAEDYTKIENTEDTSKLEASCTWTADAEIQCGGVGVWGWVGVGGLAWGSEQCRALSINKVSSPNTTSTSMSLSDSLLPVCPVCLSVCF